jgi:hypothetical protein
MAEGDITVFNEAKLAFLDGIHDLNTDTINFAILDSGNTPTAADVTPTLADYVQIGTAGTYSGPVALANCTITNTAGTIKFDADDPASWVSNGGNDADARWGLIYNASKSDQAICFLDFGANVDMSTVDLTVQWNASGIFTLA